jgi:hypothetical protein
LEEREAKLGAGTVEDGGEGEVGPTEAGESDRLAGKERKDDPTCAGAYDHLHDAELSIGASGNAGAKSNGGAGGGKVKEASGGEGLGVKAVRYVGDVVWQEALLDVALEAGADRLENWRLRARSSVQSRL